MQATLALEWVHGYNGSCTASNAFYTSEGKVVYFVAALGVVYDPAAHTQQFFQVGCDAGEPTIILSTVTQQLRHCDQVHRMLYTLCGVKYHIAAPRNKQSSF